MNIIVKNIKWIMLGSGLLTCTMISAALAPESSLEMFFGDSLSGPLANIVVRSWGILITLVGMMLIYGAFNPETRSLVAVVAAVSKTAYVCLILGFGIQYLDKAGLAVAFDSIVAIALIIYLVSHKRDA